MHQHRRGASPVDRRSSRLFVREGEYWTIAYKGLVFRLRDSKGLRDIACLLQHPCRRFAAADLFAAVEPSERAGCAADRDQARSAVTKRIRAAIDKIAQHHPSLGHHLNTCVNTGYQCAYTPDPKQAIVWVI